MAEAGGQQVAAAVTLEQVDADIQYWQERARDAKRLNNIELEVASAKVLVALYQTRAELMRAGAAAAAGGAGAEGDPLVEALELAYYQVTGLLKRLTHAWREGYAKLKLS